MLTEYEQEQLTSIQNWQADIPAMVRQCAEILYLPDPPFLGDMLPYQEIEAKLRLEQYESVFAADKQALLAPFSLSLEQLQTTDLQVCDKLAAQVQAWGQSLTVPDKEKAPLFILLKDIPPIVAAALRLAHQVALAYGYEYKSEADQRCLLEALYRIAGHPHVPCRSLFDGSQHPVNLRRVAEHAGIDLTFRKFLVQYPYLKSAVGTSASRWYFRDVGQSAQRIFQKRWLQDNDKIEKNLG